MSCIGIYEAKTHLTALLGRVEDGEEVTITRHGRPVARLVPVATADAKTSLHALAEEIRTARGGLRMKARELPALVGAERRF